MAHWSTPSIETRTDVVGVANKDAKVARVRLRVGPGVHHRHPLALNQAVQHPFRFSERCEDLGVNDLGDRGRRSFNEALVSWPSSSQLQCTVPAQGPALEGNNQRQPRGQQIQGGCVYACRL